jgi:hypothetical protein
MHVFFALVAKLNPTTRGAVEARRTLSLRTLRVEVEHFS